MSIDTHSEWSGRNGDKDALRHEIWETLKAYQATKRDPVGHIPNFIGGELAAERLATLDIWQQAKVIKCNPDSPQKPVRLQALREGKLLYMAVPRLARQKCFVALHRSTLAEGISLEKAANMRDALIHGTLVAFADMQPIDLVIVGCVAVAPTGGRTGKGAGFADLELAMLREGNLVQPETPVVTTVHSLQVVTDDRLPMQHHDWPLDWIVTPDEVIPTHTQLPRPTGLDWNTVQPEQIQKIPILRSLAQQRQSPLPLFP
ncbi:MAG: 5-formyltetrahydrofolate cyclo-ligase [Cyanobacteria bacterium P01_H01_bin.58]